MRKAVGFLGAVDNLPEGFGYTLKRRLLGPPLVNEQLSEERLSKPLALGVLSCDGISSANYGSELILHELLPFFGLAAFSLLLPMTGVIILGIALVVLSYREVVSVYTRAGGSYVVARENFGPARRPGGGRGPHGRLRGHGGRADGRRQRRDPVHVPGPGPAPGGHHDPAPHRRGRHPHHVLREPARGPRERQDVRRPHLLVHRVAHADDHPRRGPGDLRRPAAREVARRDRGHRAPQRPVHLGGHLLPGARVRERRVLADRHRGRVQRGERAPPARGPQRPAVAGHPGHHRRVPDRRHFLAGPCHPRGPVR